MSLQFLMQAVSDSDSHLYTWTATSADFVAAGFPGPGDAFDVAVHGVKDDGAGGGGGGGSVTEAQLRTAAAALTAPLLVNGKRIGNGADPVSATDFATKQYVDNIGAIVIDPVSQPGTGATTTMQTIALADNTVYEIVCSVTCRDAGNNLFTADHAQKWYRAGGGGATNLQVNDPGQVSAIAGLLVSPPASKLVASGNNVTLTISVGTTAIRYHADVYIRSVALAHL